MGLQGVALPLRVGFAGTAVWMVLIATYITTGARWGEFWSLTLENMGDFLAGAFAPLAFLWLVVAVLLQTAELGLQRAELRQSRQALELQAAETRALVEENKRSVDALVSAERAHLFVRVHMQSVQDLVMKAAMLPGENDEAHIEPRLAVSYVVKNYGKTPAVLRGFYHWLEPMVELPPTPEYGPSHDVPYQRVLAAIGNKGDETSANRLPVLCAYLRRGS